MFYKRHEFSQRIGWLKTNYAYVKVFIWYFSHKRKLMTGEVVSYEKDIVICVMLLIRIDIL